MSDNPAKVGYVLGLLSSLQDMREDNFICDFTIKVGDVSFQAHRAILAASSKYFRAMFESDMVEVKQGYIDMRGIEANVMKICLEYIYTGETKIYPELVGGILEGAHLMQLDGLVNACFDYLQNYMSAENCISTVALSRLYERQDVEDLAGKYISQNLGQVSQAPPFLSISKDDFIRYVSATQASHEVLWQAAMVWVHEKIEERDKTLVELMNILEIEKFPFQFLFEKISTEDVVRNSKDARSRILEAMFLSAEKVRVNLTTENVFPIRILTKDLIPAGQDKAMKIIKDFILENFEKLVEKEEFVHLDEGDILMLLQSPETKFSSEEIKWKAILKWTKHEHKRRKVFAKLFEMVQLERFSNKFIRDRIRTEPMVRDSVVCTDALMALLFKRSEERTTVSSTHGNQVSCIALLDHTSNQLNLFDVDDCSFTVHCSLQGMRTKRSDKCAIVNCNNEIYCLINEDIFKLGLDHNWIRLCPMSHAPTDWPLMVSCSGHIYVVSGRSAMASYDPTKNEWPMNLPGYGIDQHFCVVSSGNDLFAFGGNIYGNPTNKVRKFQLHRGWVNMAPMLEKRAAPSGAMLHGMIVVAGGYGDAQPLNSVECYNFLTRSWSILKNMISCHFGFTLLSICHKLYACGGDREPNGENKDKGTIEVYKEDEEEWETLQEAEFLRWFIPGCEYHLQG